MIKSLNSHVTFNLSCGKKLFIVIFLLILFNFSLEENFFIIYLLIIIYFSFDVKKYYPNSAV